MMDIFALILCIIFKSQMSFFYEKQSKILKIVSGFCVADFFVCFTNSQEIVILLDWNLPPAVFLHIISSD